MAGPVATQKCTSIHSPVGDSQHSAVAAVLERLMLEVQEGIRHGHFKCRIIARDGSAGCTEVVIEAGKSYWFRVPKR